MGFGIKLKEILDDRGLSMTELSKRTGITYNMIKKYCSGNADPTFSYAQMIAEELQLSLDDFMSYTPESSKPMLQQVFEEDFTFICGFMRNVHRFADKPALIDPYKETRLTYKELNREVNMLSNALFSRHIEIGDAVLYQLPNGLDFLRCYLAPQKIGAVNSPVDCRYSPEETAGCLDISRPKAYIYDSSLADTAQKALDLAEWKPEFIIMCGEGELAHGHIRYDDFISGYPKYNPRVEYCLWTYDESTRFYEKDSEGNITGIQLYSLNEVLSAHDILMKYPMNSSDISMTLLPWSYRDGLQSAGPTSALYSGGTIIAVNSYDISDIPGYINKYKVTYLAGSADDIVRLADYKTDRTLSTDSLKGIILSGVSITPADYIKIQKKLCQSVINGFGTAESFINVCATSRESCEAAGFAGNASVDDDVRVVKITSGDHLDPMLLAAGNNTEVGEIIVRSSKTSYKYIGNQNAADLRYKDGWFYTGTYATWDKKRRITIVE